MRKKIALLVGQPDEVYQKTFLRGFLGQAFAEDYDVCILAIYQKHQGSAVRERAEANIFSLIDSDSFEAVVVLANTIQIQGTLNRIEEELHEKCSKPVIVVDCESKYFHTVITDNFLPTKKVISHLIEEHGLTDIAYLTGNEFHLHAKQRLQSFLECMEEHGLKVGENRIFYGDFWYNSGKATAERLLSDRGHLPQAIACANDYMALGLIEELKKEGIRIPEDVAVVGYDGTPNARYSSVTSVTVPAKEIGIYCVKYAKALAEGTEIQEFVTPVELFIGKSCGCGEEKLSDPRMYDEPAEESSSMSFDVSDAGSMEDDILMQTDFSGVLNTIYSYVGRIRPFVGFHLCLNKEWIDKNPESGSYNKYTDTMLDVLRCGEWGKGMDRINPEAEFERKVLLPEFEEESAKPRAYYFTPMFFENHCFGYAAVNYGEVLRCYDGNYRSWLGVIMRGLEAFLRVRVLQAKTERLEASQIRDSLTGLYNYQGFLSNAEELLKEIQDTDELLEVAIIELHGLGETYRNLGSREGDKIIVDFSQMLSRKSGQEMLCYLGNGEFLMAWILPEGIESSMESLLGSLRQKLEQYCRIYRIKEQLEIVYGNVQGRADDEERLASLISEAVNRKNANKAKVCGKKQEKTVEIEYKKLELVEDILDYNRLVYFFQPIVNSNTGEIIAYEALMRADTEEKISPLEIISCAEHLGRLDDVERATFFNVLSYVEEHQNLFVNKKVFINSIPGIRLPEDDAEAIREKLKKLTGKIVIELTEQAEIEDAELERMKEMYHSLGVDMAVDDYGTGYSNVYNLLRYMPKVIKIDRMLLNEIHLSAPKQHFVKEIIEFAHNNGITVLAEGVETPEELKMVTLLGADLIQGYYTAKPKAEVIPKIDYQIQNEIVQYGQEASEKKRNKVFTAGQDADILLIKMASGHYSKIRFAQGDVAHRDVTIIGMQGFLSNVEIEIEDSYKGRIELRDAELAVYNEQPAIRLGKNCDVTLVLQGENVIEQGGILVPESSKLTIQGDGNLVIKQIAVNGYGIGNDKDSKCGEIYFEQDGLIEISGNTIHGVGIGAGLGGNIHINRGMYSIQFAGEEAVGIGALYADAELSIQSCAMDFKIKNNKAVGIGSLKGNALIDVSYATLRGIFNAKQCVGVGTLEGESAKLQLREGVTDFNMRSGYSCGIGSITGDVDLSAAQFSITIFSEGDEAIAVGNHKKTAKIHTRNGEIKLQVKNTVGFDIGAETFEMINGTSEFTLNDEKIVREHIKDEK